MKTYVIAIITFVFIEWFYDSGARDKFGCWLRGLRRKFRCLRGHDYEWLAPKAFICRRCGFIKENRK